MRFEGFMRLFRGSYLCTHIYRDSVFTVFGVFYAFSCSLLQCTLYILPFQLMRFKHIYNEEVDQETNRKVKGSRNGSEGMKKKHVHAGEKRQEKGMRKQRKWLWSVKWEKPNIYIISKSAHFSWRDERGNPEIGVERRQEIRKTTSIVRMWYINIQNNTNSNRK